LLVRVGAVQINLGYIQLPLNETGSNEASAMQVSLRGRREARSGDAVKIWNHIQVVMSGRRIICAPRG
jgi:hypothetical protein